MTNRRAFILGAAAVLAAPAIVKAENLMKIAVLRHSVHLHAGTISREQFNKMIKAVYDDYQMVGKWVVFELERSSDGEKHWAPKLARGAEKEQFRFGNSVTLGA